MLYNFLQTCDTNSICEPSATEDKEDKDNSVDADPIPDTAHLISATSRAEPPAAEQTTEATSCDFESFELDLTEGDTLSREDTPTRSLSKNDVVQPCDVTDAITTNEQLHAQDQDNLAGTDRTLETSTTSTSTTTTTSTDSQNLDASSRDAESASTETPNVLSQDSSAIPPTQDSVETKTEQEAAVVAAALDDVDFDASDAVEAEDGVNFLEDGDEGLEEEEGQFDDAEDEEADDSLQIVSIQPVRVIAPLTGVDDVTQDEDLSYTIVPADDASDIDDVSRSEDDAEVDDDGSESFATPVKLTMSAELDLECVDCDDEGRPQPPTHSRNAYGVTTFQLLQQ